MSEQDILAEIGLMTDHSLDIKTEVLVAGAKIPRRGLCDSNITSGMDVNVIDVPTGLRRCERPWRSTLVCGKKYPRGHSFEGAPRPWDASFSM